jgi:GNAT superfamily N-acetyltransferase
MEIVNFNHDQFGEYLDLVDAEIRTPDAFTHAWEDFPLLLDQGNRDMVFGILEVERVAAGLSCLVRQFQTSCGMVPVAGIGGVVTRPEFRGRGLSKALQIDLVKRLAAANVPLAVLWSDRPEYYTGRGFAPAGWEFHVDMAGLAHVDFPAGFSCREFLAEDVPAAAALYDRHPYRAIRHPGDAARLYTMPGTKGLVAQGEKGQVVATVFCGKGADFRNYVLEWGGPAGLVIPLLAEARRREWARHLLAPAGGELLAGKLSGLGATVIARETGHWLVVQPEQISRYLQGAGMGAPGNPADPTAILGTVGPDGVVVPGVLTAAVWGFDSV